MIHLYASRQHYYDHMASIWAAIPERLRGEAFGPRSGNPWATAVPKRQIPHDDYVLVASYVDSRKMARNHVIYVEHGAGQTYDGDERGVGHGSYAGGTGHEHTALFLSPREEIAERWRRRYYGVPAVAVGCPKLDRYVGHLGPAAGDQTVVFSFHWDNPLCPESMSALGHYRRQLPALIAELRRGGWRVLGHGHPRAMGALARVWRELDVPVVAEQEYVFRHASVFVADNTSALYEAAAIGIPVVCLNAPWYRRDIHHGLRFWDVVPGVQVDRPDDLVAGVERAQARGTEDEANRMAAVHKTYAAVDGAATERALRAILETVDA